MNWLKKYQVGIFCLVLIFATSVVANFNKDNGEIVGLPSGGGSGATAYPVYGELMLGWINYGGSADNFIMPNGNTSVSYAGVFDSEQMYYIGTMPCSYKLGTDINFYYQWMPDVDSVGSKIESRPSIWHSSVGGTRIADFDGVTYIPDSGAATAYVTRRDLVYTLVGGFSEVNTTVFAKMYRNLLPGYDNLFAELVEVGGYILKFEQDASGCVSEFTK